MSAHNQASDYREDPFIDSLIVRYGGAHARGSILEARELGTSIAGLPRLYTATVHYCFSGVVPRGRYRKTYGCYVTASRLGSLEEIFLLLPLIPGFGIHTEIYKEAAAHVFKTIICAVMRQWIRTSEVGETVESTRRILLEDAAGDRNLASLLAGGIFRSNRQLTGGLVEASKRSMDLNENLVDTLGSTLPDLASRYRPTGRDLVDPVGRSCSNMTQFNGTYESIISESDAEVIRGTDDMEVDPMTRFKIRQISEINLSTRHCILQIDDNQRFVPGIINDPALQQPNSIYTRALNERKEFVACTKVVRKDGEIYLLLACRVDPMHESPRSVTSWSFT